MVSFKAGFHCTLFICIWFGTQSTSISYLFVVVWFFEGDLRKISGCQYVIVHETTKYMDDLISAYLFKGALFLMTNYASFVSQFCLVASLAYKLPQFRGHEWRVSLHVITAFMDMTFTFDTEKYLFAFVKLFGYDSIEGHEANLTVRVEDLLHIVMLFMLLIFHHSH